ncbi:MAG: energy-coupling factor ABC transporter ATP-binding protein [Clostridia bacterium]
MLFEFKDVTYKDLLDIPCLNIPDHRVTCLFGPSGSGKTTLLRMLNKLISPTGGSIFHHGRDLNLISSVEHRRQVTLLSQTPILFEGTVRDNLNAGLLFRELPPAGDPVLQGILDQVQLSKQLDHPVGTLSGGEKQRLALGRVLLLDSLVYLLDEPSSALDEKTELLIIEMLTRHARETKKSIVMVTHSRTIAGRFADEVLEMEKGVCLNGGAS